MTEILTALLVVVTTVYVVLTNRIARANQQMVTVMQEQVAALDRPYIEVSTFLISRSVVVYLRIKNTGKTSARNLQLKIDRNFYKYGRIGEENNLAQLNAFNQVIETFPPKAELIFALAQSFIIFGENAKDEITPRTFSIHATYSYLNRTVTETTVINLNQYYQTHPEPDPTLDKLDAMVKSLDKLVTSVQGISFLLQPGAALTELGTDVDKKGRAPGIQG